MISRFAPAPTGRLHLGHVVNAIYVWGVMRAAGGQVLLRIEDHDLTRSRPEFERGILDDLQWLGFVPDTPALDAFRQGPCDGRQRDRQAVYEAALERLRRADLIYACDCTRADIAAFSATGHSELRYPGTCADKHLPLGPGVGLRVRLIDQVERFEDLIHGPISQNPSRQCGDLLVRDRLGHWTYQFAATVDDAAQGVTLVVRGDDLLSSTGRQIQLARLLGRASPPAFLHHPLIMKSPTQKLSKADRDTSVRDLRESGASAAEVIGSAAFLAGLLPARRSVTAAEAIGLVAHLAPRKRAVPPG